MFGVSALPTFVVWCGGAEAGRVVGADRQALRKAVEDAAAKAEKMNPCMRGGSLCEFVCENEGGCE